MKTFYTITYYDAGSGEINTWPEAFATSIQCIDHVINFCKGSDIELPLWSGKFTEIGEWHFGKYEDSNDLWIVTRNHVEDI